MTTQKTYTQTQVKGIVDWYEKENKKLKDFKDQIKSFVEVYVSRDASDQNVLDQVYELCRLKYCETMDNEDDQK